MSEIYEVEIDDGGAAFPLAFGNTGIFMGPLVVKEVVDET